MCTGLSGEPTVGQGQRSAAQSARDTWPSQRSEDGTGLSGVHRTCPVRQRLPHLQRLASLFKEGNRAPDCPVRPTTEGKDGLPDLFSTAPSCLGAIKGTPRLMEHFTKHSLIILRRLDSAATHSDCCVRDLSSIRVKDSLCCHLSSSLLLCAWVCCDLCLVCVAHPNLTPCFHCDLCCKGERLQSCGDSSQTGIII